MRFERARAVADAVLLEGYVLYPYRASAPKNRFRWPFGVLAPKEWSERGGCEPWWFESACLLEPAGSARVIGRLRMLQVHRRTHPGRAPWEEGVIREVEFEHVAGRDETIRFEVAGGRHEEGETVREWWPITGRLHVRSELVEVGRPLFRIRIRVENSTERVELGTHRDRILPFSCIAAHLLLGASEGSFVSLMDPPEWAAAAARACKNTRSFPVLVGADGERDLMLSAPIILYDYPRVAPESPGDFYDATEIDELLTLRTLTLTDEEKREARATDKRAAAIVDRVESMAPEVMGRLHGALRDPGEAEMVPRRKGAMTPGTRVRLRPGRRRTDAQDLLYAGCAATIEEVRHDVDGREYLAVTIDDDPAADLHRWYGRFHYYYPDEVEELP